MWTLSFTVLISLILHYGLGIADADGVPFIAVCAVDNIGIWIFSKTSYQGNHSKHSQMRAHYYLSYDVLVND